MHAHPHRGPGQSTCGLDDGRQLLALCSDTLMRVIDLHFHDLRHECAMRWLKRGYGLNTIAVLGHSDLDSLKVYPGMTNADAVAEALRLNATLPTPPPMVLKNTLRRRQTCPRDSKAAVFQREHPPAGGAPEGRQSFVTACMM
jgi:hypothetical protein